MIINNSNHDIIKAWQSFLYKVGIHEVGTADGYWGPHTEKASKDFQGQHGLYVDGIVGPKTIAEAEKLGFKIPKQQSFHPTGYLNAVLDLSEHNGEVDFKKVKDFGMKAVFHKATQSTNHIDRDYHQRKIAAQETGLLWGAYHFGAGKDSRHGGGAAQANFFLDAANAYGKTVLALDLEPDTTSGQSNMTLAEAEVFISTIHEKTGQYPIIYGGHRYLNRLEGRGGSSLFSKCPLWLASWGTKYSLPNSWSKLTFWQFTNGIKGPGAMPVDGVKGICDRDLFHGTEQELNTFWQQHSVQYAIQA